LWWTHSRLERHTRSHTRLRRSHTRLRRSHPWSWRHPLTILWRHTRLGRPKTCVWRHPWSRRAHARLWRHSRPLIVVTIGWARWMVTIMNRWLTEAIGGGLWGLASNVHLRKVTVKLLRLLHIWRTTWSGRSEALRRSHGSRTGRRRLPAWSLLWRLHHALSEIVTRSR